MTEGVSSIVMCGRARVGGSTVTAIRKVNPSFQVNTVENLSPGTEVPVLCYDSHSKSITVKAMVWGLIPSFVKDEKHDHFMMFNARKETIFEKPSYRRLIHSNRCVIVFDGFYEWKHGKSYKQPYYISLNSDDQEPLKLAAIYDINTSKSQPVISFSILTMDSTGQMSKLHNRQPVWLSPLQVDQWLDPEYPVKNILHHPYFTDLQIIPVTPRMNKIMYQEADCSLEIDPLAPKKEFFSPKKSSTTATRIPEKDAKLVVVSSPSSTPMKRKETSDPDPQESSSKKVKAQPTIDAFFKKTGK